MTLKGLECIFASLNDILAHIPFSNNRELYTRVFVADGNFKADHLIPKNEVDDVQLTNGEGFMTSEGPYRAHLKDATSRLSNSKRVSFAKVV